MGDRRGLTPGAATQGALRSIARLEAEPLKSQRLTELQKGLAAASKRIDALGSLVGLLDQRKNQIFAIVAWLLMWTVHCALALERWRRASGRDLGVWLEMVGELEALASVAQYTYEHPGDPLPELLPEGPPRVEALGLGHPLLRWPAAFATTCAWAATAPCCW